MREAATLKGRPLQGEVCPSPPPPPHPPPEGNGQLWSLQRGMCLPSAQHVPPPREARVRLPEDALPGQALQGGRGGCPPSPPHTLIRWGNCTEWMRKSNQHNRFPTILSHRGVREAATLKGRPLQGGRSALHLPPPPHLRAMVSCGHCRGACACHQHNMSPHRERRESACPRTPSRGRPCRGEGGAAPPPPPIPSSGGATAQSG